MNARLSFPHFLSFHPIFLHSLDSHYFFIWFPDPSVPFILHDLGQNGENEMSAFRILKPSAFSVSHREISILFFPSIKAPVSTQSLSSVILRTRWREDV